MNGFPVAFDQPPVERAGRVYVPLRGIFERLGASVVFGNGTINATQGLHTIQLRIGAATALVDGATKTLDAPPFLAGGRTLVPLRFIAQALGANVDYAASTRTVTIASQVATPTPSPAPTATPSPKPSPPPTASPQPRRSAPNFIGALRPYYDERVDGAFTVSGRTHPGSTVRIDAASTGRVGSGPWLRQGATSTTVAADDRGFFSAALSLPAFGVGVIALHVVSIDPAGNSADVRTRARFGQ